MKKRTGSIWAGVLVLALALALAGCGSRGSRKEESGESTQDAEQEETLREEGKEGAARGELYE